jgi:sulfate adenylyltransferase large subunit
MPTDAQLEANQKAANGAPTREPEVWDEGIPAHSPLLGHTPEPEPVSVSPTFDFSQYLGEERTKDLLRFSTAGSVDDGKSTLIGRLLYDTQSVYDDQVKSIEGKGTTAPGVLDLALLTDGLRAEREQGITIDVAYRYFSTSRRKFIIADTPGHEQYTRNMATGASTASLAIVLVDARKGVLIQSRRHACITALLGVPHILIAVNKMDLVGYDQATFEAIRRDFSAFFAELGELAPPSLFFVPVSALTGDNVVHRTQAMPWYTGPALLDILETVPAADAKSDAPFRLAVQRVIRPNLDFRGFAGQIAAGTIRPGDAVMVLPSRRTSRVRSIVTFDGDLPVAQAPQSITLTLEDELDISRGDILVTPDAPAETATRFSASLVWMDEQTLETGRRYLLKHTSRTVNATITAVSHRLDVATLDRQPASTLPLNGIGLVEIETVQPLAVDQYRTSRITGSCVLIDPVTNATVAAGMIRETLSSSSSTDAPVTPEDRIARWHHTGAAIHLAGPVAFADSVERALFQRGAFVLRFAAPSAETIAALTAAGALVLTHRPSESLTATVANHTQPVADADELLSLLRTHSILKGDVLS